MDKSALILAAGLGTRMNSDIPKVLHLFDNKPIINRVIEKLLDLEFKKIFIVIGHKGEMVKEIVEKSFPLYTDKFCFIEQKVLKGSGRAVLESVDFIKNTQSILIISGDVILIKKQTIEKMYDELFSSDSDCVLLTAVLDNPKSYGRVIRDKNGDIMAIVEKDELGDKYKDFNEINSGVYIFKTKNLIKAISDLKPKGRKSEYYLTDAIENIKNDNGKIGCVILNDEYEITGPNSKKELVDLEKEYYLRNAKLNLEKGVIIRDINNTYISEEAVIEGDTIIYPGSYIIGRCKIGKNVNIGPYVMIYDSVIENNCIIKPFSYIDSSFIKEGSAIGPFSHIRPECEIGPYAKIGNFSELKKSKIGKGSKVPHLSYIGDTEMGDDVNIGAGTITCNYDGKDKHKTIIGDRAFIGSNTNLVAPIQIGRDVIIGAGSTITDDVPDGKLAIARERQVIKDRKK